MVRGHEEHRLRVRFRVRLRVRVRVHPNPDANRKPNPEPKPKPKPKPSLLVGGHEEQALHDGAVQPVHRVHLGRGGGVG